MEENQPSIVVVSSSNTKPKSLIKLITNVKNINEDLNNAGKILHPWIIDTKYYTAHVNIIGLEPHYQRNEDFNNNVEALLIHMDSNKESGLDDLKMWEEIINDCQPEIKLLVANYCKDDTKITKTAAVEWCLKRGFEFIELYPTIIDRNEEEDQEMIPEKFGVDRVVEALQAHSWSNLVMKNNDKSKNSDNEAKSADILTAEGLDDFTELFSHLHTMKESIQSLPMNERKKCAEEMVTAFWKAIGGEEEELLDL